LNSDPRKQILSTPRGEIFPPYGTILLPLWEETAEFSSRLGCTTYIPLIKLIDSLGPILKSTIAELRTHPVLNCEYHRALIVKATRLYKNPGFSLPQPFPDQCFSHMRFSANLTGWVETKGFEGTVVAVRAFGEYTGGNIGMVDDRSQKELRQGGCLFLEKAKRVCVLNFEGLRFQFEFFMPPREEMKHEWE
jgi:hypothetical protein